MQGRKTFQQPLFVTLDLNQFVPREHKLRRLDKALDLKFLRDLTAKYYCHDNGRKSVDPQVFFRMLIIKYLYGIDSDRALCDEIHLNVAYRWFCGFTMEDEIPHHSTLGKIRDRLGEEVFRDVFEEIVRQCQRVGLLKGVQLITDATLIRANASDKSLTKIKKDDDDEPKGNFTGEKISRKTHVSTTDPDATSVGRPGHQGLYYKAHVSIDGSSRVITDCHVTTGAVHECQTIAERVDYQLNNFDLKPSEWLADRGYGHGPTYEFFSERGIRTYIPLRDKKLGKGKFAPHASFKYDKKEDIYTCPNGEDLEPHSPANGITRYRIVDDSCQQCEFRLDCLSEGQKAKRIQRSLYQIQFDKVHQRSSSQVFKAKLKERSWKIEGVFGEGKTRHKLGRAQYRGRAKMQIQVYLIAMVINLKRLVKGLPKQLLDLLVNVNFRHAIPRPKIYFLMYA